MNTHEYQNAARRTAKDRTGIDLAGKQNLIYAAMKVPGEAGEVAETIAKMIFHGHPFDAAKIAGELGDLLWHISDMCDALGITMEEVMRGNLAKLDVRYKSGYSDTASIARVDVE